MTDQRNHQLHEINTFIRLLLWQGHRQSVDNMAQLGLTLPQAVVLLSLETNSGRASMSDLARFAEQSPATVTGIVDRLITAGWVERARDPNDRRVVWVQLTPEGWSKVAEINQQREQNVMELTKDFSSTELEQFKAMIVRMLIAMGVEVEG